MLAAVLSGYHDFTLKEVQMPQIEKDTDILLKVTATAICTSDVHFAEGYMPISGPFTCGHEFVGVVEEIGSAVKNFKVGDRVDVASYTFDNTCEMCKKGLTGHCINGSLFGSDKAWGGLDGALAEYVRVPMADTSCIKVPDNVSDEYALLVGDMLATGYTGIKMAELKEGQTVVVYGLGPVGLCAIALATQENPDKIIAVGRRKERLDAALACGATHVIDTDKEDVVERIKEITGGDPLYPHGGPFEGYVDSCIDCCGFKDATANQIKILRTGGIIAQVGMPNAGDFPIDLHEMCMKNLTLRGGLTDQHHMPYLMDCLASGKINVDPIITQIMDLKDFDEALDIFAHKKNGSIKVVLKP